VADEFEAVRRETDPLRQARRATELLTLYQQRSVELARLRREAIDRAQASDGLSYAQIAESIGLSKGRIGQIKQSAPPAERALFGVGPVTVAIPLREVPGRSLPVISSEDELAAQRMTALLGDLGFQVEQFRIPVDGAWKPHGDVVAICGPKSSPVVASVLASDPTLDFHEDERGRWVISDRDSGKVHQSPMDTKRSKDVDLAYVGRVQHDRANVVVVAGIHALGSLGAVDHLAKNAAGIYREAGSGAFSMIVRSTVDRDGTVTESEAVCPPRPHHGAS
jgi:hypothetical protein